jgi:carotenoid cleavage dioxygenase-like enzyme
MQNQENTASNVIITRRDLLRGAGAIAVVSTPMLALALDPAPTTKPAITNSPVYTQGHYKPTQQELTVSQLTVHGSIPHALSGRYLRNGHNPNEGCEPKFWFAGNGMVHGVRLHQGKAQWYKNRYVKTPALNGAPLFRKDGSMDMAASAAGTSIFAHAGKILALQEVNLPYLLDADLNTTGVYDFGGKLKNVMTAHPKIDRLTGEMLFISNSPKAPHLTFHQVSPTGELMRSEVMEGPGPSVMHDFAITENYVVFFDPSVVFAPRSGLPFPYAWDDKYQAKVGLLPRDRTKGPVQWISIDPAYMFHFGNAWEEKDGKVVVEGTYYDQTAWNCTAGWVNSLVGHGAWVVDGSRYARCIIDLASKSAKFTLTDDLSIEFPTINPSLLARKSRYTYVTVFPDRMLRHHAIAKYDNVSGKRDLREFKLGQMPSEPWFVADPNGTSEDHGWLMSYVSDLSTGRGALWIIDATAITSKPIAIIDIPSWIPAGVHGSWVDDRDLRINI